MKVGDLLQCHDKAEAIKYMMESAKYGLDTKLLCDKDGKPCYWLEVKKISGVAKELEEKNAEGAYETERMEKEKQDKYRLETRIMITETPQEGIRIRISPEKGDELANLIIVAHALRGLLRKALDRHGPEVKRQIYEALWNMLEANHEAD